LQLVEQDRLQLFGRFEIERPTRDLVRLELRRVHALAEIMAISPEQLAAVSTANACQLFNW